QQEGRTQLLRSARVSDRHTEAFGNCIGVLVREWFDETGLSGTHACEAHVSAIVDGVHAPIGHPEETPRDPGLFFSLSETRVGDDVPDTRTGDEASLAVTVGATRTLLLLREAEAQQSPVHLRLGLGPWPVHAAGGVFGDLQHAERYLEVEQGVQAVGLRQPDLGTVDLRRPHGQASQTESLHQRGLLITGDLQEAELNGELRCRWIVLLEVPGGIPGVLDHFTGEENGSV